MTEATGSQNPSPPASEPWKKVWNDVTTAVADVGSTVKQAVTPSQGNPWDKEWSSATPPAKPRTVASKPSVEATSSGTWDEINKKYAQGQPERDKAQLHTLQAELAKEKDPKNIASLQREISRVTANIKGNNG